MNKCKKKSLFLDNLKGQNKEKCVNTQGPPEPGRRGPFSEVRRNRSKTFFGLLLKPLPLDFPPNFQTFLRALNTHEHVYNVAFFHFLFPCFLRRSNGLFRPCRLFHVATPCRDPIGREVSLYVFLCRCHCLHGPEFPLSHSLLPQG